MPLARKAWWSGTPRSSRARQHGRLAAAFERKYPGVKVQLVAGTATDLLTKLLAEARIGSIRADVHQRRLLGVAAGQGRGGATLQARGSRLLSGRIA